MMVPPHRGASPGWCKCDEHYVGKYCNIRGVITNPPVKSVPVRFAVQMKRFRGLDRNGDNHGHTLLMTQTWDDPRMPWDSGTYRDATALGVLGNFWIPKVTISGTAQGTPKMTLIISRNPAEQ